MYFTSILSKNTRKIRVLLKRLRIFYKKNTRKIRVFYEYLIKKYAKNTRERLRLRVGLTTAREHIAAPAKERSGDHVRGHAPVPGEVPKPTGMGSDEPSTRGCKKLLKIRVFYEYFIKNTRKIRVFYEYFIKKYAKNTRI